MSTLPAWQVYMKKTIAAAANELVLAQQRVAAQQTRFSEATRRVKLLERLREKRLDHWQIELNREEEAFAAEAFLARSITLNSKVG